MKNMLFLLLAIALNLFSFSATGQVPGGSRHAPAIGYIYGKLVDSSGKGISDASVLLLHSRFDSATKKSRDILLKGVTSQSNGDFSFEDLPLTGILILKISAAGYQPLEQEVSFQKMHEGAGGRVAQGPDKDLGRITLSNDVQQLAAVTVTANSGRLRMDIDKKVFSVDQNMVSAGGTALDVIRNVPSVNVDMDGNIALRNAAPQIFVDGRPTLLSLDQIPADAIESVEVITNPSAKYDASGGGAGILNIVLKKNRKTGYNGNLRAGIDKLGGANGGGDFNVRQGRINFFGSLNVGWRRTNTVGFVKRLNLSETPPTYISQDNKDLSTGRPLFVRAGFDHFITNRTTLSFAAFHMNGRSYPAEQIYIDTDSLYASGTIRTFSERRSEGNSEFNGRGLAAGMKYIFPKPGKEWTADASWFGGHMVYGSLYTTTLYSSNNPGNTELQKIMNSGSDDNIILQTDYTDPVSDKAKWEAGLRAAIRGRANNNSNDTFDHSINDYKPIPGTSINFRNTDNVYAAYASVTKTVNDKFGYNLGLRAESSNYTGELTATGERFRNRYPVSLFPSVFVSRKMGTNQELQASITRRINRPNFFQLIPFADYTDELNITQGNPALKPEFTTSVEASYARSIRGNNNLFASIYYKKTNKLITRFLLPGTNPFTGKAAIINTYINADESRSFGTELTSQTILAKWWDMTTNLNLYNAKINSGDKSIDSKALWSWFGKWNNNFKLPYHCNIQLSASYQSKTQLTPGGGGGMGGPPGARGGGGGGGFSNAQSAAQGYIEAFYSVDLAVRKAFLKNNTASLTLSFNDIFRTRTFNQYSESKYFVQTYSRLRDPQMIRLTLAYRFGKVDALLFKRRNTNTEEGGQGG